MIYEFGVMSSRYELESDDEIIAKVCMSLYLKTSAPIVIYSPVKTAFKPNEVLEDNFEYCKDKTEEVIKGINSIKKYISSKESVK